MATTRVLKTIEIYKQDAKNGLVWNRDPGEESSQAYKAGAPLVEDGSSLEMEIWAGGTDTSKIVGIAAKDATATAGSDVPYYEANQYNLFAGSIINNTSAIALATTHINTAYSLIASGDNWYIDIADTTTKKVIIIRPIDDIGDTNARVVFRFCSDMEAKVLASA